MRSIPATSKCACKTEGIPYKCFHILQTSPFPLSFCTANLAFGVAWNMKIDADSLPCLPFVLSPVDIPARRNQPKDRLSFFNTSLRPFSYMHSSATKKRGTCLLLKSHHHSFLPSFLFSSFSYSFPAICPSHLLNPNLP